MEANMDSTDVADRESVDKLDQATSLLMVSLQQSKALNIQIQQALQQRKQANAAEGQQAAYDRSASVFRLLKDIIDGVAQS
jgi:hypothetical protein